MGKVRRNKKGQFVKDDSHVCGVRRRRGRKKGGNHADQDAGGGNMALFCQRSQGEEGGGAILGAKVFLMD